MRISNPEKPSIKAPTLPRPFKGGAPKIQFKTSGGPFPAGTLLWLAAGSPTSTVFRHNGRRGRYCLPTFSNVCGHTDAVDLIPKHSTVHWVEYE